MLYDPAMTDDATTVQTSGRKIKRQIGLLLHPDKSPYGKAIVPAGTPPLELYQQVFGEINDAMHYYEVYLVSHQTVAQTLLPVKDNPLATT